MTISAVNIVQDNKVGSSDLFPVHSPLVFLVDATYSGTQPTDVRATLTDIGDATVYGPYKLIPFSDPDTSTRRFAFVADEIIRGIMGAFEDQSQPASSLVAVTEITKDFTLIAYDPEDSLRDDEINFTAIHAAKQHGDAPNLSDIYANTPDFFIGYINKETYVYFYNTAAANDVADNDDVTVLNQCTLDFNTSPAIVNIGVGEEILFEVIRATVLTEIKSTCVALRSGANQFTQGANLAASLDNFITAITADYPTFFTARKLQITRALNVLTVKPVYELGWTFSDQLKKDIDYTFLTTGDDTYTDQNFAKGYVRKSISKGAAGNYDVIIHVDEAPFYHALRVKEICTGDWLIKYLDKKGQYRFYAFSKIYQMTDAPQLIGKTNKFITSLLTDLSDKEILGYKNNRIMRMRAACVPADELLILSDLFTSPRVFIYDSSLTNWVQVELVNSNPVIVDWKHQFSNVDIEIRLPANYCITML